MKNFAYFATAGSVLAGIVACSANNAGNDVDVDVEANGLEPKATNTMSWSTQAVQGQTAGTWSATSAAPELTSTQVRAKATMAGPSGGVAAMGVCLVKMWNTGGATGGVTCNSEADCTSAPTDTQLGSGARYCTKPTDWANPPDGKAGWCAFRTSTGAATCAGSPALPWRKPSTGAICTPGPNDPSENCAPTPVGPGTYYTPYSTPFGTEPTYVSYSCVKACEDGNIPSVSGASTIFLGGGGGGGGGGMGVATKGRARRLEA